MTSIRLPFFIEVLALLLLAWAIMPSSVVTNAQIQHGSDAHVTDQEVAASDHGHSGHANVTSGWEGSAAGVAYSERNHHVAGWLVIIMGLAELSHALRLSSLAWARFLLPAAMTCTGLFLMIWSDHEAWPIGHMSVTETFFGQDHETIQHKTYGLLALLVGAIESFRRLGHMGKVAWATPLPLMAIIGGLMLFAHSHGAHPAAHKIAMHHTIMGTMAITAGSSKLWSGWSASPSQTGTSKWELLWSGLILLIGAQLLIYSE